MPHRRGIAKRVWCVPALRVPLVHSLINHFIAKKSKARDRSPSASRSSNRTCGAPRGAVSKAANRKTEHQKQMIALFLSIHSIQYLNRQ